MTAQPEGGGAAVQPPPAIVIRCRENGPYVIQGPVKIVDHLGQELAPPPGKPLVALCRCGASKNKPFCDGSHKETEFRG